MAGSCASGIVLVFTTGITVSSVIILENVTHLCGPSDSSQNSLKIC